MRVVYLIAGAGGMYCGSCLRDNRLAAALIAQKRDVVLIPLYTPIRTDETDVSQSQVYYGGVNVYLQQKSALFRRLPARLSRWFNAPSLLLWAAKRSGLAEPVDLGAMTVSILKAEQGEQRRELDRLIDGLRAMSPDLVVLPNLMFVGLARSLKSSLNVPILCMLSGEDIFLDALPPSHARQADALIRQRAGDVDAFLGPTRYFSSLATRRFSLPTDRVHVVNLGVGVDDVGDQADPPAESMTIGYLARICPEKGLANLCEAFVALRRAGRSCRLRVAGYLGAEHRPYLEKIMADLRAQGVADEVEYLGEVDRAGKLDFLRSLHLFSVPTVYHEAKGLYVLEALACGVPVVLPAHGSFPELVQATDGGLLYDPGRLGALAETLAGLMDDPTLRAQLADRGRKSVHQSFTDRAMARQAWSIFSRYGSTGQARSDAVLESPC